MGFGRLHWAFACSVAALATLAGACDESAPDPIVPDAGDTKDAAAPDAIAVEAGADGGADGGALLGLEVAPLPLTPPFSPDVHDYYVQCAAGPNAVTITTKTAAGTTTLGVDLLEDQAVVVQGEYWIRCLPHDFPGIVVTTHPEGSPTPGWYLLNSTTFAMVLDVRGTPVWYARGTDVLNVASPAPNTLSFSPNASPGAYGIDPSTEFDVRSLTASTTTSYKVVGSPTDGHEFVTLPNGNHLMLSYELSPGWDLTGLSTYGPNETIADCLIQEIDGGGNVVWSWLGSDHVDPLQESLQPASGPVNNVPVVDVFHCNAIDADSNGNLLVSMRHASAAFYVQRPSGVVQWKLGGSSYSKDGAVHIDVQNDPETTFSMQHDVRLAANGHITMFDNHGKATGVARGVDYAVDHNADVATVAFQFLGTAASAYEGSFRRYADGDSVIGWGYIPTDPRTLTEVNAAGDDVLDIGFEGGKYVSYRAIKVPLSQLDIDVMRATAGK